MIEVYKEYENTGYEVSNFGNVRSHDGTSCRVYHAKNIQLVSLRGSRGLYHTQRVARMVLSTFKHIPSSTRLSVGYRDGNSRNVALDNLVAERVTTTIKPKKVYEFTPMGELVATHDSLIACAQVRELTSMTLSRLCRTPGKLYQGRVYQYEPTFEFAPAPLKAKPRSKRRAVYQYDLDGRLLRSYRTIEEVGEFLNLPDTSLVHEAITGLHANLHGFIWSDIRHHNIIIYKKQQFYFALTDLEGNVLKKAYTLAQAEKEFEMNRCTIYEFLAGKSKYHRPVRVEKVYLFADALATPQD